MRVSWDYFKNLELESNLKRGGFGFNEVISLFKKPYLQLEKNDDPLQFLAIGWVDEKLYSLIYESREDDEGEYKHLITFWPSTKKERREYEKQS